MPTSTTRKTIRQSVIKKLYRPRYPVASTTTSSGSSTALNDTILAAGSHTQDYIRGWVYVVETVTSGPAYGEVSRVVNTDFSGSTSQLTLSPAMTATIQTGTDYEIHYWFHPDYINDRIDEILQNLEFGVIRPATYITDGSMETAGVTSWATLSNATRTKDTTLVLHGTQALAVTPSAANGYVQSATVLLPPSTQVLISTDAYIPATDQSAKIVLWDVTNGEEIDSATTSVLGWSTLQFTQTTPADCYQVALRLQCVNDGETVNFDHAILLPIGYDTLTLPSEAEWHFDLAGVVAYPRGRAIAADNFRAMQAKPEFYCHAKIDRDETAVTPYRVSLAKETGTEPIWFVLDVDYAAFAGASASAKDADTTKAPPDLVQSLVIATLLDDKALEAEDRGQEKQAFILQKRADRIRQTEVDPYIRQFREVKGVVHGAVN